MTDARLEEKRIALRRALKREYMKQYWDPENMKNGKRVFDSAFYRFNAVQNSTELLVRHNARQFGILCATFIIPVILITKHMQKDMVSLKDFS